MKWDPWDLGRIATLGLFDPEDIFNSLTGRNASDRASKALVDAVNQAMKEIQSAKTESMGYMQPYLKNAPQDYDRYRNMVQSGYFSQGAPTSFQAQNFTFDPSQKMASFGINSFAPLALPQQPQPAQAPAPTGNPFAGGIAPQQGPMGGGMGQTPFAPYLDPANIAQRTNNVPVSDAARGQIYGEGGMTGGVPGAGMQQALMHALQIYMGHNQAPWNLGGPQFGSIPRASGPTAPINPPSGFGFNSYLPGRGGYGGMG